MNTSSRTLPPALASMRAQAGERWRAMGSRERAAISLLTAVLVAWLIWSLFISSALATLRTAPAQLEAMDLQLQTMQRLSGEAKELRGAPPVSNVQAVEALKSATGRLGDKARITTQGDRSVLTLNGVSGEQLRAWLSEARSGARARTVEAQLTRGPNGYAGTLTVTVGAGQS